MWHSLRSGDRFPIYLSAKSTRHNLVSDCETAQVAVRAETQLIFCANIYCVLKSRAPDRSQFAHDFLHLYPNRSS